MKRIPRFKKRTWVLAAVVAVIAAMASIGAYAYWTTSGSGSGSASTGADTGVVVNQTSTNTGLYPGGSTALSGNFTNPASFNQYVTSVSASIPAFSVQADNTKPACTEADFFISGSPTAVGQQITPGPANGSWSGISLNMTNTTANQDNCKNVSVAIAYTSN
jgi:hypothetical protein